MSFVKVPYLKLGIRDSSYMYFKDGIWGFQGGENEIRSGNYERDAGFGDSTRRKSRNLTLNKRDSGSSVTEINRENQTVQS